VIITSTPGIDPTISRFFYFFTLGGFYDDRSYENEGEQRSVAGFSDNRIESFNFDAGNDAFPGDDRNDIPTLPEIESPDAREPDVRTSERKSTSYFDIMSDFFDEPRIDLAPKHVAARQLNLGRGRPQSAGFFGQQQQQQESILRISISAKKVFGQIFTYYN
jgi:hypothetical protein